MKRLLYIVLCMALALPMVAQEEELCIDGTLLFREDFGGNDPNDPIVGTERVAGMDYSRYTQRLNSDHVTGQPGLFWLIKSGYYHADTTGGRNPMQNHSNWYLQDDHTYPNDKSRGYLLEIDGLGGKAPFYSTVVHGVCPGTRLTFSAYVANVNKTSNYQSGRTYVYPRLKFEIEDAKTHTVLGSHSTGDIPYDPDLTVNTDFWYSSKWYLHGMTFTMPEAVDSIRLTIYNDVMNNGSGNDFALDDIEIRLCQTPDTIRTDTTVCDTLQQIAWRGKEFALADTLRDTLLSSCGFDSIYYELHVTTVHCEEELCIDGTLLFREDFGGNDPSDPAMSMGSVPGMSSQYYNSGNSLGSGHYTVRKEGWANGIQWHRQDDHTYPDDKTRGYLLEVDGRGGAEPFYSKTIDGLCAGSKLTFSAYVVNVHYAGQLDYFGSSYVYPRMKFVLKDPTTGTVLAEKSTGDIQPDWRYGTPETWKYARDNALSAEWQLVGMNFVVPDGIESIQMFIYNDVERNGSGNDFALDDIEIHLCAPPATIEGDTEVCVNKATTLTANFSNDGTFAEPLEYKWWHSTDSLSWTEMPDFIGEILTFSTIQKSDSGWYKVAVSGDGNIESVNCRAVSDPFRLKVNECEPPTPPTPELCLNGILLFREDFGGNDPNDPRVGTTPVSGMSYTQLTSDRFGVMRAGKYLVTKSGYCNGDTTGWSLPGADQATYRSQWYIQDDHTYPNDYSRGYFMEIDGSGGNQQFYQTEISGLCEGIELTFSAYVANVFTWFQYDWYTRNRGPVIAPCLKFVLTNPQTGETLVEKNTQQIPFAEDLAVKTDWQYSSPWYLVGMNFIVPTGIPAIRLTIYNNVTNGNGNDFALDDIEIRLCMTPDTIRTDTTVCDTLQQIAWRGKEYAVADTLRDTVYSHCGFDSIYYELHVATEHCEKPEPPEPPVPPCPEVLIDKADTTVCDTLMPFTWRGMVYEEAGEKRWMEKSPRDCDSIEHVLTLSTIHCEKPEPPTPPEPPDPPLPPDPPQPVDTLWEIIVNKYNWQLLCNNVALRGYFPGQTATAFQWYKNEQAIPGATGDDYSEHNELRGVFQLNVRLDDGRSIWSNIIEIDGPEDAPTRVQIYNSQGMPVSDGQVMRGVYLYRYEKGEEVWTEKKIVL